MFFFFVATFSTIVAAATSGWARCDYGNTAWAPASWRRDGCDINRVRFDDFLWYRQKRLTYKSPEPLLVTDVPEISLNAWNRDEIIHSIGTEIVDVYTELSLNNDGIEQTSKEHISVKDFLETRMIIGCGDERRWREVAEGNLTDAPYMFHELTWIRGQAGIAKLPRSLDKLLYDIKRFGAPSRDYLIIGSAFSGLAMHSHEESLAEAVVGRKAWYFLPASCNKYWNVVQYLQTRNGRHGEQPQNVTEGCSPRQCIQHPGELLYVPAKWGHATINLDDFVGTASHFVDYRVEL